MHKEKKKTVNAKHMHSLIRLNRNSIQCKRVQAKIINTVNRNNEVRTGTEKFEGIRKVGAWELRIGGEGSFMHFLPHEPEVIVG